MSKVLATAGGDIYLGTEGGALLAPSGSELSNCVISMDYTGGSISPGSGTYNAYLNAKVSGTVGKRHKILAASGLSHTTGNNNATLKYFTNDQFEDVTSDVREVISGDVVSYERIISYSIEKSSSHYKYYKLSSVMILIEEE